jgi:hypothetical protein
MEAPEVELDPRLLAFAEQIRIRSGSDVTVEDNKVIVGVSPNCAVLFVNKQDNRIWVSFHRECHPLSVVTTLLVLMDSAEPGELHFIHCFLSDVKGVLSYESEPGFDLLHVQYLRDILGVRGRNIFRA